MENSVKSYAINDADDFIQSFAAEGAAPSIGQIADGIASASVDPETNEVTYDSGMARSEVRNYVRGLTDQLRTLWTGANDKADPWFGSFEDLMTYKSKPKFMRFLFIETFLWTLGVVMVPVFIAALASGAGLLTMPQEVYKDTSLFVVGALVLVIFLTGALIVTNLKLDAKVEELKRRITDVGKLIESACLQFIHKHSNLSNQYASLVVPNVSTMDERRDVKLAIIGMNNHWRTLERIASYIRHDWDNYVRDCGDHRDLPKYATPRLLKYILVIAMAAMPVGACFVLWAFLRNGAAPFAGLSLSLLLLMAITSGFSVVWTFIRSSRYDKCSRFCAIKLTEALKTHKKERALEVLDVSMRQWLRASGREKEKKWDGWTKGYSEKRKAELVASGLSEYEARLQLSADPVIYVGNAACIRLIIADADPADTLIRKIPAQQKTG